MGDISKGEVRYKIFQIPPGTPWKLGWFLYSATNTTTIQGIKNGIRKPQEYEKVTETTPDFAKERWHPNTLWVVEEVTEPEENEWGLVCP